MKVKLQIATPDDVSDLVSLRNAVSEDLTSRYGKGHWSMNTSERGVLFQMTRATVYVAKYRRRLVATLALSTRKPWAINIRYFNPRQLPLYLTGMAVAPDKQRRGIGRLCIGQVLEIARQWPADTIRLDAYDAAAGGGEFYRKCGFREVGRASYKANPLIYFEMIL
jgi:GNAT superfamily N-acetyltransferase